MKWRPVYLRVSNSSTNKFIFSFHVNLHMNLSAFPQSNKYTKFAKVLQKGVAFHWIRVISAEEQQVKTGNICALVSFTP